MQSTLTNPWLIHFLIRVFSFTHSSFLTYAVITKTHSGTRTKTISGHASLFTWPSQALFCQTLFFNIFNTRDSTSFVYTHLYFIRLLLTVRYTRISMFTQNGWPLVYLKCHAQTFFFSTSDSLDQICFVYIHFHSLRPFPRNIRVKMFIRNSVWPSIVIQVTAWRKYFVQALFFDTFDGLYYTNILGSRFCRFTKHSSLFVIYRTYI